MCRIYSNLIQNVLFIINLFSTIDRRSLIFVPINFSRRNKHFGISYDPLAENWIFGVLYGHPYHAHQGSGWFWFWCRFFICSRHEFSCPIHFSRSTDIKVMSIYVPDILHSPPEWPFYHQFLLHHWLEESNFCTNRFVSSKRRFWYIIWPHNTQFDFRCFLWS